MRNIVIYGAGGFAREVAQLIEDINKQGLLFNILGYIDDNKENTGKELNGYPVLGTSDWLTSQEEEIAVAVAVGAPKTKRAIVEKLKNRNNIQFPNLIHPSLQISEYNVLGKGNIICEGNILTCNIQIKDFVTINLNCTVGHDTILGNYCTILPNSSISGNVHFKEGVDFGTNATIIQGVEVGEYSIIGAGAVVVKDIPSHCTAVGMPAKPIKFHESV
jgi:sugar O-acyltransferase (sialic acid O-acetyltransferase NeuD family)